MHYIAIHCNTLQNDIKQSYALFHIASYCETLQNIIKHYFKMQNNISPCNTLQIIILHCKQCGCFVCFLFIILNIDILKTLYE